MEWTQLCVAQLRIYGNFFLRCAQQERISISGFVHLSVSPRFWTVFSHGEILYRRKLSTSTFQSLLPLSYFICFICFLCFICFICFFICLVVNVNFLPLNSRHIIAICSILLVGNTRLYTSTCYFFCLVR